MTGMTMRRTWSLRMYESRDDSSLIETSSLQAGRDMVSVVKDQHREITQQNENNTQGLLNRWKWGFFDGARTN
jgi:hypothetical protein